MRKRIIFQENMRSNQSKVQGNVLFEKQYNI